MTKQASNNAIIYCRVSTKEQVEEGNSLVTQEKVCKEFALKHGYNVVKSFIEQGESAKTADRTELQNLLKFCSLKKSNIEAIIIYKIDRLSRNTDDYSHIRLQLKKYGVEIKSTSEHFEDNPAGRFMENIIANVAQFDNEVRTERSVGGMRQAVLEGRYVWPAPPGYINAKVSGKATIVLSDKAPIVRKVFLEVATGNKTVNEIRISIAKEGLSGKDGKPLSKSPFYRMLSNELYIGNINKLGESVKGLFEPLISEELFEIVQRKIKSKKAQRFYTIENPEFPLRRFVTDATGEKLTGSWSQGKLYRYPYYRFLRLNKSFRREAFEKQFFAYLESFGLPDEYYSLLMKSVAKSISLRGKSIEAKLIKLKHKEIDLKNRKQLLIDKCLNGTISDALLKEQLCRVEEELLAIAKKNESLKVPFADPHKLLLQHKEIIATPGKYWLKQPFELKKRLLPFQFPKGIVFEENEFRTPEIANIFKLKSVFKDCKSCMVNHRGPYVQPSKKENSPAFNSKQFIVLWADVQKELIELREMVREVECNDDFVNSTRNTKAGN